MRLIDTIRKTQPDAERAASAVAVQQTWNSKPQRDWTGGDFPSWVTNGIFGNPVVFAVLLARLNLFTEAEFKWRNLADKRLFGTEELARLEHPWPGATTADLLGLMEIDAFAAGNAFVRDCGSRFERLRPDYTDIVRVIDDATGAEDVIGYVYRREGTDEEFYPAEDVAHWAPIPDPLKPWRGMAVMAPIVREINNDSAMTDHTEEFFQNAATPNLAILYKQELKKETFERLRERFQARYGGASGDKTMILDTGADIETIGSTFESMAFTALRSAGEARIASAASVPPIVAGLQAGLDAATYSNFAQAQKAFGNNFMRSHWRSLCGALSQIVKAPQGARLWFDVSDIAALQEGETERAEAAAKQAETINSLIMSGHEPQSVVNAVLAEDFSLLKHSGRISVQLYPNGEAPPVKEPTG